MSIETVMNHSWFLNKYQTPSQRSILEESNYYSKFNSMASTFNVFDIISMSSRLDLSGLLETGLKKEKRCFSAERLVRVMERVKKSGRSWITELRKGKEEEPSGWRKAGWSSYWKPWKLQRRWWLLKSGLLAKVVEWGMFTGRNSRMGLEMLSVISLSLSRIFCGGWS